jgi:hypothetical protein
LVFARSGFPTRTACQVQYAGSNDIDTDATPAAIVTQSNYLGGNTKTSHTNTTAAKRNAMMDVASESTATPNQGIASPNPLSAN